ncbi:MAG: DUF4129 domain-containing protein [Bacteroidia bacterium]
MKMLSSATERFVRLFMLVLLAAAPVLLPAKTADSLTADTSKVMMRQPDPATQKSYYSDDYYRYERKRGLEEETFFDRLLRSMFEDKDDDIDPNTNLPESAESISRGAQALNYFLLALAVGLLVWGLIRALKSGSAGRLFSGKTKGGDDEIDASVEDVDIHSINYETQIAAARDRGDFRYAVRLWFLSTLKNFTDRELLNWKPEKTNMDYYYELSDNPIQKQFGDISRVYDYVWYGERAINAGDYERAEEQFRDLNRSLN